MIVITRTFYLESASILFDNNRRSQFRAGRGGATRFEYKKKKKEEKERENTAVNTPLSDLQLSVQLHGYRIYRIAFFSGSNFVLGLVAVRSPPGSGSSVLKKMIGMWLRLVTCSNRFLRVRFMEGKLSCFIFSFFFVFSPEFQSRSTDFELLHRIVSLSEFDKFNKGRICRSRTKENSKIGIWIPNWIEELLKSCNGSSLNPSKWVQIRRTRHRVTRNRDKNYILSISRTSFIIRLRCLPRRGNFRRKREEREHLHGKPRNILTSIVSVVYKSSPARSCSKTWTWRRTEPALNRHNFYTDFTRTMFIVGYKERLLGA